MPCENPIVIPNLNRISPGLFPVHYEKMRNKFPWKDFVSINIPVPCGFCASCIRAKQDSIVQRVRFESQKNHLFMATLTYRPEVLPKEFVNGYSIPYANVSDFQKAIKMLRKDNAFGIPFRHLTVSEFGSEKGRPHFHSLFLFPKSYFPEAKDDYIAACDAFASKSQHYFTLLNYWRRNIGSRRNPLWQPLTRYVEKYVNGVLRKNYDFHYVNPYITKNGVEDCGMYVLKYMFKPSDRARKLQQALRLNLSPGEYEVLWRKIRPRYFGSIGFGYNASVQLKRNQFEKDSDILEQILSDIAYSRDNLDFPAIFNSQTGIPEIISPYYLKNSSLYSYEDRMLFWNKKKNKDENLSDGVTKPQKDYTLTDVLLNNARNAKTQKHCDEIGVDADFSLLD